MRANVDEIARNVANGEHAVLLMDHAAVAGARAQSSRKRLAIYAGQEDLEPGLQKL